MLMISDDAECDAEVRPRLDLQTSGRGATHSQTTPPIVPDHVIGKGRENLLSWFPYVIRNYQPDSSEDEYFLVATYSLRSHQQSTQRIDLEDWREL